MKMKLQILIAATLLAGNVAFADDGPVVVEENREVRMVFHVEGMR